MSNDWMKKHVEAKEKRDAEEKQRRDDERDEQTRINEKFQVFWPEFVQLMNKAVRDYNTIEKQASRKLNLNAQPGGIVEIRQMRSGSFPGPVGSGVVVRPSRMSRSLSCEYVLVQKDGATATMNEHRDIPLRETERTLVAVSRSGSVLDGDDLVREILEPVIEML